MGFLSRLFQTRTAEPVQSNNEVRVAGLSHPGHVRPTNQDAIFFRKSAYGAFATVADGMGGAQGGSVASQIAAQIIPELYLANRGDRTKALRKALKAASAEIHRRSRNDTSLRGMGTTCVALDVSPPFAWAAWVGDSRLYLIRGGQMYQLSEDHSVVREMVRRGMMSPHDASDHEERNLVTRALGGKRIEVAVWAEPFPVCARDRFLLSTDGLHDALSDDEMLSIMKTGSVEDACAALVRAADERGGHDNISAVVMEIAE